MRFRASQNKAKGNMFGLSSEWYYPLQTTTKVNKNGCFRTSTEIPRKKLAQSFGSSPKVSHICRPQDKRFSYAKSDQTPNQMNMKKFSTTDIETIAPAKDAFNQFQIIVPADELTETGLDHILGGNQALLLDCDCTGQNSNMGTGQCECPWSNENVSDADPQKAKPSSSCSCIFANTNGDTKKKKKNKK